MNKGFMSDNTAPADSRILNFLSSVNEGFEKSYGHDSWTDEAARLIREEFGEHAAFYPVLTGTGANVISLAAVLLPFQGVVCADSAHINVDECGAPERFLGSKLIALSSADGKITPEMIKPCLHSVGFEHHSQPRVISISQAAETGVVYTPDELENLSDFARENRMIVHIDGSRIAGAAAYLGCSLADAAKGADILSFGGTKNGMMMGEAVVVLNPDIGLNMKYHRKQGMQLFSKMRYISAQFIPYLKDKIWRENAEHANAMAVKLAEGFESAGFELAYPVNSNAVFVKLDDQTIDKLSKKFGFYVWDEQTLVCRFMCSFAIKKEDVDELIGVLHKID